MRIRTTIIATLFATMMQAQGVIDMHSHIITPEFMSALDKEGRLLDEGFPLPKWDAEAQLKWMDEAGIHTSVLTLAAPQPTSAKVVRATNEAAAKLKYEHPDRFRFCAALPLPDVDAAIEEARYALDVLRADGIYLIKAKGHTKGNSIIIVEMDGLFYMLHGDITYVDEALYEDKQSIVFDDLPAARETLNRVREFVRNHPTVYCGTHTPQGYENLEAKRVMDLDNPVPTILAEVDFSKQEASGKYVCSICGYVYDPAEHDGVAFEDLPDDWRCPRCKQPKEKFNPA